MRITVSRTKASVTSSINPSFIAEPPKTAVSYQPAVARVTSMPIWRAYTQES